MIPNTFTRISVFFFKSYNAIILSCAYFYVQLMNKFAPI